MDKKVVDDWLEKRIDELATQPGTGFASSHLYEIDSSLADGVQDIANTLSILQHVDREAGRLVPGVIVRALVEVGWSTALDTNLPDLENLPIPQRESDPQPAIYLINPELLGRPDLRESYRCSYLEVPWGGIFAAEYVCSRQLGQPWSSKDFGRDVWIQVTKQP